MQILDGKALSRTIKEEIKAEVDQIRAAGGRKPHLVAILVGDDGASRTYVRSKMRGCEFVGFKSTEILLPASISQKELLNEVRNCNDDPEIDGLIVQLPLPAHLDPQEVTETIHPDKDVDGFHPINVGRMTLNHPALLPATPYGIVELLNRNHIETQGKHIVVVGRSNIVGMPTSILLSREGGPSNATISLCHIFTPPKMQEEICRQADILIVAVGKPGLIRGDMVKEGVVVIDVGITRVEDPESPKGYVLKGDVDYDTVAPKASYLTPVPGGVGPMTVTMLLKNTLLAYQRTHEPSYQL
jgi:methylenetetrahydrofolate dehydrogenase (NADP+)/methenyltetrahydrofolate cyclohydrolase